jgi:IPT/TIG domain
VVTGVSPDSGGSVRGGTVVTISGTGLADATGVSFGGAAATIGTDSGTQVTATSPPGKGTVNITVATAAGTSAVTSADQFTYTSPPPPPPPSSPPPLSSPPPPAVTGVNPGPGER